MSDAFSQDTLAGRVLHSSVSSWRGSGPSRRIADGVDAPSCITSRYLPTEKLKLRVRSSRRRKALLQLFLALGERCTDDATERARNGKRDRDRGRPMLLVRPVSVVAVTSTILYKLSKWLAALRGGQTQTRCLPRRTLATLVLGNTSCSHMLERRPALSGSWRGRVCALEVEDPVKKH